MNEQDVQATEKEGQSSRWASRASRLKNRKKFKPPPDDDPTSQESVERSTHMYPTQKRYSGPIRQKLA